MIADRLAKKLIGDNELKRTPVVHNGKEVNFIEVKPGCFIDEWLDKWGKAAITLGRTVILRQGRTTSPRIRHELVHVDQWAKYGDFFFLIYPLKWKEMEEAGEAAEKKRG